MYWQKIRIQNRRKKVELHPFLIWGLAHARSSLPSSFPSETMQNLIHLFQLYKKTQHSLTRFFLTKIAPNVFKNEVIENKWSTFNCKCIMPFFFFKLSHMDFFFAAKTNSDIWPNTILIKKKKLTN